MEETKKEIAPLKQFNQFIAHPRTQDYLTAVLADKKASFVNNITALVSNNANLQVCAPETLMYSALKATALDLPLDQSLGFAYVLPYKDNKKGKTFAQFQMGYKGFVQLALRTGQFKTINATDVREGELVNEDFVTGELTFKRAENREALPVIGYVAYFKLLNGFEKYLYMTTGEMKAHALKFSQTFKKGYGLWAEKESFDAMARKTVLKLLLSKYAPLSVEMQNAIKADQAVVREEDKYDYVDNQEQPAPQTESARKKAEEVQAQVAAMKARKNGTELPENAPAFKASEEEDDLPADEQ